MEAEAPRSPTCWWWINPLGIDRSPSGWRMQLFSRCFSGLADHPDCTVVLKVHPDVISGRARGHFKAQDLAHPHVRLSADGGHRHGCSSEPGRCMWSPPRWALRLCSGRCIALYALLWRLGAYSRPMQGPLRRCQGASLEALVHAAW